MSFQHVDKLRELKSAAGDLRQLSGSLKNTALLKLADLLVAKQSTLLTANEKDVGAQKGEPPAFVDRLTLNQKRIEGMAESLRSVAALPDPVGEVVEHRTLKNGLKMRRVRSPIGVILLIFESRPNVVTEAFSMAFKSGNAIILRGGRESQHSAQVLYQLIREALQSCGLNPAMFWGLDDYDRGLVEQLLKEKEYIDIVVPRGGEGLIQFVQKTSLMPIIKNDRGLCHEYIHEDANLKMAIDIAVNGKLQRPSVCNSLETLLIHQKVAEKILPDLYAALAKSDVEWFVCDRSFAILQKVAARGKLSHATDENYNTEYLDYKINCKVVDSFDEALKHIEEFGSKHSEMIITQNETVAHKFQSQVDAAAVYWNASTRFTDGFEMGLGGELGISTQKLHVRGPVGLKELTTARWIIDGTGQIRD